MTTHISAVEVARRAEEQAERYGETIPSMPKWDADQRWDWMQKYVEREVRMIWGSEAYAQLAALDLMQIAHEKATNRPYMADFTEKMREQLIQRISAFGEKAYALFAKQFQTAVKAAW